MMRNIIIGLLVAGLLTVGATVWAWDDLVPGSDLSGYLPLTGGTVSGKLTATKIDGSSLRFIGGGKIGSTLSGDLVVDLQGTGALDVRDLLTNKSTYTQIGTATASIANFQSQGTVAMGGNLYVSGNSYCSSKVTGANYYIPNGIITGVEGYAGAILISAGAPATFVIGDYALNRYARWDQLLPQTLTPSLAFTGRKLFSDDPTRYGKIFYTGADVDGGSFHIVSGKGPISLEDPQKLIVHQPTTCAEIGALTGLDAAFNGSLAFVTNAGTHHTVALCLRNGSSWSIANSVNDKCCP